jgi:DNA-binding HxlR family transcriptional regulator
MANQVYGQYCGLARALEVVGEPWALMVVRDLVAGPKSFDELCHGLPGISADTLSARLVALQHAGAVQRRKSLRHGTATVYELTTYGSELEEVVFRLGRWGAKKLGEPRRGEIVTPDSMHIAFRTLFRPAAARGMRITYVVKMGDFALQIRIDDQQIDVGDGLVDDADLVIEAGPALRALLAGDISAREALETGSVRLTGDRNLFPWFIEIFHIPPAPPVQPGPGPDPALVHRGDPAPSGHFDRALA